MTETLTFSMFRSAPLALHSLKKTRKVFIRKDPKTGETVGVTILDYEEHFRQLPDLSWLAKKPFPEELVMYLRERPVLHG